MADEKFCAWFLWVKSPDPLECGAAFEGKTSLIRRLSRSEPTIAPQKRLPLQRGRGDWPLYLATSRAYARLLAVMDETPTPENPVKKDFNKLDLSQLQGFSFGTQWSQEKADPKGRSGGRDDAARREGDRRDGGFGPGGGGSRDRRGFRRPLGSPGESAPSEGGGGAGAGGDARPPRENRPAGPGDFRGGPRREGPAGPQGAGRGEYRGGGQGGGERGDYRGGPRFGGQRDAGGRPEDRGPYISPHFNVTFYPEDASFTALAKTIRSSCRTFELFDIAKTVIGKPERFVVVLARKTPEGEAASAAPASKPAPLSLSVPDGLPFENDDAVIAHVLEKHLGLFFDVAEVEVEPPKGNFQVINKCGITGELLGPPNYHRYNQILQQHHAARIKGLSFEAFRSRVESVREPEAVVQWQEKMKKATRYTWKLGNAPAGEGETPAPILFDSFDEARMHLLMNARDKVVRSVDGARFHGMVIANLPPGEIRRAIEGALERQRRFPLDTANALRGRLRRESFTIFKKGSKGISYVCAVKRKFRVPGQTFAETIGNLIAFIEANPMVRAADLPSKLLGISVPPPPATPPVEGASPAPTLTLEEQSRLSRMQGDLRWLVTEGYVTEFIDGRLFAPPAMVEARKKEIENAEHDPENFPDSPAPEPVKPSPAPAAVAPVEESAPVESAPAVESGPSNEAGTAAATEEAPKSEGA